LFGNICSHKPFKNFSLISNIEKERGREGEREREKIEHAGAN
jgi:hypothetical protein